MQRYGDEQESNGSIQRRSDRYSHYDHGPGTLSSSRRNTGSTPSTDSKVFELCPEFRIPRYLLEQSPSPASGHPSRRWPCTLGESPFVVLAIPHSVRDGMDGRESVCALAGGVVWRG